MAFRATLPRASSFRPSTRLIKKGARLFSKGDYFELLAYLPGVMAYGHRLDGRLVRRSPCWTAGTAHPLAGFSQGFHACMCSVRSLGCRDGIAGGEKCAT